jgi:hypothetical protein
MVPVFLERIMRREQEAVDFRQVPVRPSSELPSSARVKFNEDCPILALRPAG